MADNIIKNADWAEYAFILSLLHLSKKDLPFPIIFQINNLFLHIVTVYLKMS